MKHLKDFNSLNEGITADEFTSVFVNMMQKHLPKDRFTVSYEHGEIKVTNDFGETGTYRMETFESNEGTFRAPNFPSKGSASEHVSEGVAPMQQIKDDLTSFGRSIGGFNTVEIHNNTVTADIRDLGNWIHDEEAHYDDEDDSWQEDDDAMIWAPGQYKLYMEKFKKWAETKAWFKKAKLGISTSEKNWVEFEISIN